MEGMLMLVLRGRGRRSATLLLPRSVLTRRYLDLGLGLSLGLRVSVDSLGLHLLCRHLHVRMRRRGTRCMRRELLMHLHLRHGQGLVGLLRYLLVSRLLGQMLADWRLHVLSVLGHVVCLGLHGLAVLR